MSFSLHSIGFAAIILMPYFTKLITGSLPTCFVDSNRFGWILSTLKIDGQIAYRLYFSFQDCLSSKAQQVEQLRLQCLRFFDLPPLSSFDLAFWQPFILHHL